VRVSEKKDGFRPTEPSFSSRKSEANGPVRGVRRGDLSSSEGNCRGKKGTSNPTVLMGEEKVFLG